MVRLRGRKRPSDLERNILELRERVEYLEDSLAAFVARAERDERAPRSWVDVRGTGWSSAIVGSAARQDADDDHSARVEVELESDTPVADP
jgi:hypothetical protein